jgi:hypothetical protein
LAQQRFLIDRIQLHFPGFHAYSMRRHFMAEAAMNPRRCDDAQVPVLSSGRLRDSSHKGS